MVANDERDEAGERAEAEQLDEEDRQDDLLEAARHREDGAAEIIDRRRRDVFCRADADRDRQRDADHGGDHRHPEAFGNALDDFAPAADEVGREECREELRAARQAFPDARPVHLGGAERQRQIDRGAERRASSAATRA